MKEESKSINEDCNHPHEELQIKWHEVSQKLQNMMKKQVWWKISKSCMLPKLQVGIEN